MTLLPGVRPSVTNDYSNISAAPVPLNLMLNGAVELLKSDAELMVF